MTKVFASPTLARCEANFSLSTTRLPVFASPFTPKESTPPKVFGRKSFLASACEGWLGRPGYKTQETFGWFSSHFARARALSQVLWTRKTQGLDTLKQLECGEWVQGGAEI